MNKLWMKLKVNFGSTANHNAVELSCLAEGDFLYTVGGVNTEEREPDATLSIGDDKVPTIIFEFEDKHRSCRKLDLWCRSFFCTAGVRQVIGFKMYPKTKDG